jgi:hypothetical protein
VAHNHMPRVRKASGAAVVTVTDHSKDRERRTPRDLAEAEAVISQVTRALIGAVLWGGEQLDSEGTDPQRVAEGLLDRIGAVLVTVTDDSSTSPNSTGGSR